MEVQLTRKWHRHHKLWRKKIALVAGLRKGRGKEFGRTLVRVRGRNNRGPVPIPFSLPLPNLNPFLSLSKACCACLGKDSKRSELSTVRHIAKKIFEKYVNMSSSNTRGWRPNYTGIRSSVSWPPSSCTLRSRENQNHLLLDCLTRHYISPLFI